jgi:hypothetical protein
MHKVKINSSEAPPRSRCLLMVITQESAQSLAALNRAVAADVRTPREQQDIALPLVIPLGMEMFDIFVATTNVRMPKSLSTRVACNIAATAFLCLCSGPLARGYLGTRGFARTRAQSKRPGVRRAATRRRYCDGTPPSGPKGNPAGSVVTRRGFQTGSGGLGGSWGFTVHGQSTTSGTVEY